MLASVLTMALARPAPPRPATPARPVAAIVEVTAAPALRDAVMAKFHAMNEGNQGIFHDDITPLVAPYFPDGQTFAETRKVLEDQKLGPMMLFKGRYDQREGRMYVSMFSVMTQMFSSVSVVVRFDFAGTTERTMVLRHVSAFLQASNM